MTRKEKAQAIINKGEYIIHPCNLLETAPQDETSIYYLQEEELDEMLPTTDTDEHKRQEETLYLDIESGETVTREQLEKEYQTRIAAGEIEPTEQDLDQYIENCLTRNNGTLEIIH